MKQSRRRLVRALLTAFVHARVVTPCGPREGGNIADRCGNVGTYELAATRVVAEISRPGDSVRYACRNTIRFFRVIGAVENPTIEQETRTSEELDLPWQVVVHNDPVNLMTYVTMVFQKVFGFPREKAERHMLEVHQQGPVDSMERGAGTRRNFTCNSSTAICCSPRSNGSADMEIPPPGRLARDFRARSVSGRAACGKFRRARIPKAPRLRSNVSSARRPADPNGNLRGVEALR